MESANQKDDYVQMFYEEFSRKFKNKNYGSYAFLGGYGSGKSTVLKKYISKIEADNENAILGKGGKYTYVITYNAWENKNPSQVQALIIRISEFLDKELLSFKKKKGETDNKAMKQRYNDAISDVTSILKMIIPLITSNAFIGVTLIFASTVATRILKHCIKTNLANNSTTTIYEKIKEGFSKLTINSNVLLIVDDLDRCFPEKQLDLLESLHHISDDSKIISIVSLASEQLSHTLKSSYGESFVIYDYLSKVFNGIIQLENHDKDETLIFIRDQYLKIEGGFSFDFLTEIGKEICNDPTLLSFREIIKVKEILEHLICLLRDKFYKVLYDWDRLSIFCFACAFSKGEETLDWLVSNWKRIMTFDSIEGPNEFGNEFVSLIDYNRSSIPNSLVDSLFKISSLEFKDSNGNTVIVNLISQIRNTYFYGLDVNIDK